jgi:hypothetical protein
MDRDPAQPPWVVEGLGEDLGLAQTRQNTPPVARRQERRAQSKPKVDGLLTCVACLRQMRQGIERLLEVSHSLAVGRPRHGLLPCLLAVGKGLVPHFPSQSMVGQAVHLLSHPVSGERLKGLDDAGV